MMAFLFIMGGVAKAAPGDSAIGAPAAVQSAHARAETVKALKEIRKGRWSMGRDIIAQTHDPLAAKLYYWLVFTKTNDEQRFGQLVQFIRRNPGWPSMRDLQASAERKMPDDLQPGEVTAWFDDYPPTMAEGMNLYVRALMKQGRREQAHKLLEDWWAKTPLTRDNQKLIFTRYGSLLSKDAHRRRSCPVELGEIARTRFENFRFRLTLGV